jgi:hypothetical protein
MVSNARSSPTLCGGRTPPGLQHPPSTYLKRGVALCGVCVSGRDEVRMFGTWWGLEMYKMLSQVAI